ncbi:polysaccharide biosynthesis tyrosine autokinase [Pseudarthrobacter phenanthrenivorans]|uniref:polysaccharide biosynthesis tyrosine autokinase n=1 Tax=Pseudarthrobacter phenanthrenivorans TaxID=361575 RepID=UPI002F35B492
MDLSDYVRIIRRNWIVIVACCLLGLLGGAAASMLTTPTYNAKTRLFVAIQSSGSASDLQQGNTFSQARMESYVETVGTPAVLQPAISSLGLKLSPDELAKKVQASADLHTVIITISAADPSPVQAAAIAQAVSDSLIQVVNKLESPSQGGSSPVKLSVVTPASAPEIPSAPNTRLNIALGGVIGLSLGIGLTALRTVLDTKVRGEADLVRLTPIAVLGGISFDADAAKKPLITQTPAQSPRAESFRQVRTNLQFANVSKQSKSILITSSLPGEGKSTTAANLAISLAEAGQTVALVDADLRRPRISEYLGLDRNAGLTTALIGHGETEDLLQPWGEHNLYVLTSGQLPPNPSELLGSESMKGVVHELERSFDVVVIDAPPLLPVTDAAVLAQQVGGVVMVVGSSRVKVPDLQKALKALELVQANVLGVVLNLLPVKGSNAYSYSYYGQETTGQHAIDSAGLPSSENKSTALDFDSIVYNEHPLRNNSTFDRR